MHSKQNVGSERLHEFVKKCTSLLFLRGACALESPDSSLMQEESANLRCQDEAGRLFFSPALDGVDLLSSYACFMEVVVGT